MRVFFSSAYSWTRQNGTNERKKKVESSDKEKRLKQPFQMYPWHMKFVFLLESKPAFSPSRALTLAAVGKTV